MIKYIDDMLIVWGNHFRDHVRDELGYSGVTTLGRLVEQGPGVAQATSMRVPTNEIAELVETHVTKMDVNLRTAVKLRYIRNKPTEIAAKYMHCHRNTVTNRINQAHAWLHKRLVTHAPNFKHQEY